MSDILCGVKEKTEKFWPYNVNFDMHRTAHSVNFVKGCREFVENVKVTHCSAQCIL